MAAGLAHEIKNPLASLTGSIQILKESVRLEPDYARLMQIVLREADRLSSLVNNFLLFARPPVGRSEPIVVEQAINETVEFFEKDGNCRGRVCIRKHLTPGLQVEMDPVHLRQVMLNLLLNASEAINGSGTIDIKSYSSRDRQVCIEVADDGCGISPEIMKSIFDPFFTTKQNGTGLGLSIVHSILESYDSRLDVHSVKSRGTRLVFHLKQRPPT
jgi:two-component system sensor histidine kinase PilS (NtrC family)